MSSQGVISERELTRSIRELANVLGWHRYHTWLAKHSPAGFPDEVLVRPPRIVFAELKTETGKIAPAQADWLDLLHACGLEVCVWRPSMLDDVARFLQPTLRPVELGPGAWHPTERGDE